MKICKKKLKSTTAVCLLTFIILYSTIQNGEGQTSEIDINDFVYSSYFGGSDEDLLRSSAIDSQGNMIVSGQTLSTDFPVSDNAFQDYFAGGDNDFHAKGIGPRHQGSVDERELATLG